MHVHNVFPLLSPAIFDAAAGTRTGVVNTLHNYRTVCAAPALLRNGLTCTACIEKSSVWPALRHGCYRKSRLATIPVAASVALHRGLGTYARHVDAFIALTQFQKSLLVDGGLPEQNMYVKPNCYSGVPNRAPWREREDKAVFIGRLSAEKGADSLVKAWLQWGESAPKLEIIGEGPESEGLRRAVQVSKSSRVVFTGQKKPEEARALLSKAKLLILPSEWFEGFPLVLCEALAFGVPVAASHLGPFEELVQSPGIGRLFTPRDPVNLQATVAALWQDQAALAQMSRSATQEFETKYSAQKSIEALEAIYKLAISTKARRAHLDTGRLKHFAASGS